LNAINLLKINNSRLTIIFFALKIVYIIINLCFLLNVPSVKKNSKKSMVNILYIGILYKAIWFCSDKCVPTDKMILKE